MTPERTIEAFEACAQVISKACPSALAKELSEFEKKATLVRVPLYQNVLVAGHLLYMCEMGKDFVREGREAKAMRWLGFLQGSLWGFGIASIDEMKHWNMPKNKCDDGT